MIRFSNSVSARLLRGLARAVCRHPRWFKRLAARVALETNLFTSFFYKGDLAAFRPKALLLVLPALLRLLMH